jgi:hypothetical protein
MWMDAYLQDTLMRERMAEAEECAARAHLLRRLRPPRTRRTPWEVIACLFRRPAKPATGEMVDFHHASQSLSEARHA